MEMIRFLHSKDGFFACNEWSVVSIGRKSKPSPPSNMAVLYAMHPSNIMSCPFTSQGERLLQTVHPQPLIQRAVQSQIKREERTVIKRFPRFPFATESIVMFRCLKHHKAALSCNCMGTGVSISPESRHTERMLST